MTATNQPSYESFRNKRNNLLSVIDEQIKLLSTLGIDTRKPTIQNLKNHVSKDAFSVLVLGEFKVGKSTLINGLLGQEILPAFALPCTAIINEIKWGDPPRAIIHYKQSEDGTQQQPEEIPLDRLEEYVVIRPEESDNYVSPYEKVEIFWPLELCHNGVEIIDSPGLSESVIREQITLSYLPKVDAILFVFSCEKILSIYELNIIQNIKNLGYEDIFFVGNRFNSVRKREREGVKTFAINKLSPYILPGKEAERAFFVSAVDALDGRLEGDKDLVINSGVPDLETKLEKFLASDRGKIKLTRAVKILKESIQVAQEDIPKIEGMLQTKLEELKERYDRAQESLENLEVQRQQIVTRITLFSKDLKILILDQGNGFYHQLAEQITPWIEEYQFKNQIKVINPLRINEFVKENIEELVEYLKERIEAEFISWQKEQLQPFINERLEVLKEDLNTRASQFIREVEKLRAQLASVEPSIAVANLERLFYSAGISTTYNIEWVKAVFGFTPIKVATSAVLGAIIGYSLLLGLTIIDPIVVVGILVASVITSFDPGEVEPVETKIQQRIKQNTSQQFSETISNSRAEQVERFATDIIKQLSKVTDVVDRGLVNEIQGLKDQVTSVIREKNKGEANVEEKVEQLKTASNELKNLEGKLDDIMISLDQL